MIIKLYGILMNIQYDGCFGIRKGDVIFLSSILGFHQAFQGFWVRIVSKTNNFMVIYWGTMGYSETL